MIDDDFKKRVNRVYILSTLCVIQIIFLYYILTSHVWQISIFLFNISIFYLPPVIIILYENFIIMKKYETKSFGEVSIKYNTLMGKNFLNQTIFIENPTVIDWGFHVGKSWRISKNDELLTTSFIKLS